MPEVEYVCRLSSNWYTVVVAMSSAFGCVLALASVAWLVMRKW